jgi:serine beta-lactamase-like protein LACTB, mitochondrial
MVRRRLLLPLIVLALGAAAPACAYDAAACRAEPPRLLASPAQARAAHAALERALAEDHGGGVQAAVMQDGRLIWSEAIGVATAGPDQPLSRRTQMRIGSVSKLFTATAAARLHAERRLDLDAPVQAYVGEFPVKSAPITVRQLATHTSGLRHYNFAKLSEGNNTTRYPSLTAALRLFADDPLVAAPATAANYSSFGFNLLGVVVERASGLPFPRALDRLVSGPFKLRDSVIDDPAADLPCRTGFFTVVRGEVRTPAPGRDSSDYYPSGGLLSTAEDLARLGDNAFHGRATPAAARRLVRTRATLNDGSPIAYTFGWQLGLDSQGRIAWYGHGGTTNGAYASLRHYPESGVTVAVIANYNFFATSRSPAVLRAARDELPGIFSAEVR